MSIKAICFTSLLIAACFAQVATDGAADSNTQSDESKNLPTSPSVKAPPVCNTLVACPDGTVLNPLDCVCECRTPPTCLCPEAVDDRTCGCVEDQAAVCGQPCTPINCGIAYYWDTASCSCKPLYICIAPKVRDPNTGACVCPASRRCTAAQIWSPETCSCICPRTQQCAVGKVWNPKTCQCECRPNHIRCLSPKVYSNDVCGCVCSKVETCIAPRVWNAQICSCQCKRKVCPAGSIWNPNTCSCICRVKTCLNGEPVDPKTCRCPCQETCEAPLILNPQTCTCRCPGGNARCFPQ